MMLSQSKLPLLVTSYEAELGLPVVFSSAEAMLDPARPEKGRTRAAARPVAPVM